MLSLFEMMSTLPSISVLLDRLSSTHDRDHRFIALKDLHAELSQLTITPASTSTATPISSASSSPSSSSPSLPLDSTSESKIIQCLLVQLLTSSSELQELTVSTLTVLVPVLHSSTASSLVQSLLSYAFNPALPLPGQRSHGSQWKGKEYEDDEEEDSSSVDRRQAALSTLLSSIPALRRDEGLKPIAEKAVPLIMDAVEREKAQSVAGAAGSSSDFILALLALLSAFLVHHAAALDFLHADVLQLLLSLLSPTSSRLTVKAAIGCLASLAPHLSPSLFSSLIAAVESRYGAGDSTSFLLISSLATSSPASLSPHVSSLLQLLLTSASTTLPAESQRATNEERESCLLAIEALMRGCGAEVLTEVSDPLVLIKALQLNLSYDPNFVGADDMEEDEAEEGEGVDEGPSDDFNGADDGDGENRDGEDDEFVEAMSDEEVVDEEDTSGTVRRAASKCVLALLAAISHIMSASASAFSTAKSKPYLLLHSTLARLIEQLAPLLLSRFHERTDHILIDLLTAFERCVHIARSLRLSVTSLLPQPALNKAVGALLGAKSKPRGKLSHSAVALLTQSHHTLAVVLDALPPHTLNCPLSSLLKPLSSLLHTTTHDPSPSITPLLASTYALLSALIVQVGPGEWVSELDLLTRLLVAGVSSPRGAVVEAALGALEETVEMLNAVGVLSVGPGTQVDPTLLPMTLLDAACEVESEEERRNSWRLRGEEVLTTSKALASTALAPKQVQAMTAAASKLVPALHAAVIGALRGAGDRGVKAAALNSLGLLYSHLPTLASAAAPAADVLALLQGCLDSPLTRVAAARALARVARCVAFVGGAGVEGALVAMTATLVGYLRQTDRALQHSTMAALNTLTLRVLAISLHQSPEPSTVTTIAVVPALTPLVRALVAAYAPLHALLSQAADWLAEMDSALTLLSHVTLAALCCADTQAAAVEAFGAETSPRLLALVSSLPASALSYSLSLSTASVYALYFFICPPAPTLDALSSTALTAFTAAADSPRRCRVLTMAVAAAILASTLSSVRGFSEVKAEIGWMPPSPPLPPHAYSLRAKGEEEVSRHLHRLLHVLSSPAPQAEKAFALGVLGEVGCVHSLAPALYPGLLPALRPTGEPLDVARAVAFGLVVIGNPVELYPLLTAQLALGGEAGTGSAALALHSLHEVLHHLAHHQVVALSHPFNSATVQPHSIPFPSTSLILLIQALSASIADRVLPLLFSLAVAEGETGALAGTSLTRLMALFPAPTLTAAQAALQRSGEQPLGAATLDALASFVSVYLSHTSPPLPSQSIDAHHRHNVTRPKILPPTSIFTAQLFSLLPTICPLLTSPSLQLRGAAVRLLTSVAVHAPQLLTVHLSVLVREWEAFVRPDAAFIVRRAYGPITREVDEAAPGRVEGWEMMRQVLEAVEVPARWYAVEGGEERGGVVAAVVRALGVGLEDEGEVQRSALGVVAGVVRALPVGVGGGGGGGADAGGEGGRAGEGGRGGGGGEPARRNDQGCSQCGEGGAGGGGGGQDADAAPAH